MGNEWRIKIFDQCAELIRNSIRPDEAKGMPYIGLEHIAEGQLRLNAYGSADEVTSIKTKFWQGDILFGKLRPYFRKVIIAPFEGVCSTDIWVVRAKNGVDQRFLFYWMASKEFIEESTRASEGTKMPRAQWEFVSRISKHIPPLPEQRAIAHILGTLDDKIELNRRMNQTLEEMARAIFKSWFVDFDPVRAKAAVRREHPDWSNAQVSRTACPTLKPEIAELFPDEFENSELGEIPKGWEIGTIKDCCIQIQNGGTPSRKEPRFWEGGMIPWLTSAEVRQPIITTTENFITEVGLEASSAKWVSPLSSVVALYGATAGQVSLVSLRLTTNQAVCALLPKQYFEFFNYLWMRSASMDLKNKAVGSAQQNISQEVVANTRVLIPPQVLVESFNEIVKPLFVKWIYNLQESRTLAALRDALLPKLISGEIRVKDAEKIVRRAV